MASSSTTIRSQQLAQNAAAAQNTTSTASFTTRGGKQITQQQWDRALRSGNLEDRTRPPKDLWFTPMSRPATEEDQRRFDHLDQPAQGPDFDVEWEKEVEDAKRTLVTQGLARVTKAKAKAKSESKSVKDGESRGGRKGGGHGGSMGPVTKRTTRSDSKAAEADAQAAKGRNGG
jgi:hypothetical protein